MLQTLTPEAEQVIPLEACRYHPDAFAAHYLVDSLPLSIPDFHIEIYNDLADRNLTKIVEIAPTGFAKTSIVGFCAPLWIACYRHYNEVLYISGSGDFAAGRLRRVRAELENNEYIRQDFDLKPGSIWRDDELELSNGVRLLARGKGSQVQGMRPDIIILDDLEDDKEVRSEIERAHLWEWLNLIVFNRLAPGGRIFVIGSLISKLSYLNKLISPDAESRGWQHRIFKAQDKQGRSVWRERFSDIDIENRKRELSGMPGAFEALYQADVSMIQKYTFNMNWVRYWNVLPDDNFPLYAYIDPAVGVDIHNDYTAISIGGMDAQNNLYLVDFIKKRFNVESLELFDVLLALYDRYKLKGIGIETNGFQKFLKVFFDMKCKQVGKFPNIIEVNNSSLRTKEARISSLAPMFQSGKLLINRSHIGLITELEGYPEVDTDDGLDSLAGLKDIIVPGKLNANKGQPHRYQPRNPYINI
jgi:predicted phage terminase large subunit-like protein